MLSGLMVIHIHFLVSLKIIHILGTVSHCILAIMIHFAYKFSYVSQYMYTMTAI